MTLWQFALCSRDLELFTCPVAECATPTNVSLDILWGLSLGRILVPLSLLIAGELETQVLVGMRRTVKRVWSRIGCLFAERWGSSLGPSKEDSSRGCHVDEPAFDRPPHDPTHKRPDSLGGRPSEAIEASTSSVHIADSAKRNNFRPTFTNLRLGRHVCDDNMLGNAVER